MKYRAKDDAKRSKGGATVPLVFVAVSLVILLPVLYVLSTGPAAWLESKGYVSRTSIEGFYSPVWSLCHRSPAFLHFIVWWQDCFAPAPILNL